MNAFRLPFRFVAVTFLSSLLVLMGLMNLRDRAAHIYPDDGIFWIDSGGALEASEVEPAGPGSRAGIRVGDRLNSIENKVTQNIGQYADVIYDLQPGSFVTYRLENEAGVRDLKIQLGFKRLLTLRDVFRTVLGFLYLGIGVFVVARGSRLARTLHFYLICLAAFVILLYSWTPKLGTFDWWIYGLSVFSFLLLPPLFVHFCLRFPASVPINRASMSMVYVPALLLAVMHMLWILGRLAPIGLPRTAGGSAVLDRIQLIHFLAGFVIGGALLLKRRMKTSDLIIRQQMKWISYGALAGILPFGLIYALPVLMGARANFVMDSSVLSLALLPLSVGYALIRFRLMDVESIARRSAAYFIASLLLLALYLIFVLVMGKGIEWIAPPAGFVGVCLAVLVIALLFAPLRNAIQERLDRLFYKDQFEHRSTLLEFARTLSSEINLHPLTRSILDRVSKTFQIPKAAIFLSDPARNGFFCLADTLNLDASVPADFYLGDELDALQDPLDPLSTKTGSRYLYRAGPSLAKHGLFYLQDLRVRERRVGMIALGQLPGDKHFSTEDLELLSALAGYAAMALENASLYRSVETKARELERLKTYTENIIESINVAVLALDSSGRITSCNRAFELLYAADRRHIVGTQIEALFPSDVIASIQNVSGASGWELRSPANLFKLYLENRRSERLIVNLSLIPILDPSAARSGLLIVLDDITEKVQLEDQLLQAEKLSSVGLLAAGIAHEVNTPLAGISSYTQMLLKETPDSDRRKHILEKIEKQTFRAAEIVNGLLNFSRMNTGEFNDLSINQLIGDSLALLSHQLEKNHIRVESRLDPSLPMVHGNLGKLQQVFINLFLNARDAMPSGGDLTIQTGMSDSMIVVDIFDTGIGIPQENIKKIFDPFFTTKAVGKGTGLGLAISYGIIQEHGGRIFVDSNVGKGTHFRLKLPTRLH